MTRLRRAWFVAAPSAAFLLCALLAGCAGSGEPPRPTVALAGPSPEASAVGPEATGSLGDPAPHSSAAIGPELSAPGSPDEMGSSGLPQAPVLAVPPAPAALAAVTLAPVSGLSPGLASILTRALAENAPAYGFKLKPSGADPGALMVKGYLAPADSRAVVHVWDVYDAGGQRLHRVEGTQPAGAGGDWAALPPEAWDAIARETWGGLSAWLRSRGG